MNCGCTSELPKAVIRRRAVLSTLQDKDRKRNDDSFSLHHNPDEHFLCLICFSVELDNMRTCCMGLFCLPQLVYLSK